MNKIPEQQKYRTEVVEQNLKVMLAENQNKTELTSVQKYRITTGEDVPIIGTPI